uniref:MLO-like protein n=1 Tax=Aegilops tauschii subsp. strangulata TaxID=200361 RepID=A0A453J1F7_AEGTS
MIIMEMALEIQDRASVIKGAPVVEPSNKFFWFHRPDWVLFFIHLTLFQNAFQMAHFVWTVATPGLKKCFHMHIGLSIMKVVLGLALQFLCSYITFPLYALVTQADGIEHEEVHLRRADGQGADQLAEHRQGEEEGPRHGHADGADDRRRNAQPRHVPDA